MERCEKCDYPALTPKEISVAEYCALVGHDGGEMSVPDSAREEGTRFVPLVKDGLTIGGRDEIVYSHEYLFLCVRCGYERRTRR